MSRPLRTLVLWTLIVPASAGAGLLIHATSEHGLGVSHDSVLYLDAAQTIVTKRILATQSPDGRLAPLTHYPPLYPLTLAAFGASAREIHQNSRLLNIAIFAATIVLTGALAFRCAKGSLAVALTSAGLAALSLDLLVVHSRVWSEPIFLFLTLVGLLLLTRYTTEPNWRHLCLAAFVFSLAWLTRYIGIVFVPAGVLVIWFLAKLDRRRSLLHAALFSIVVSAPMVAALLRNKLRAGSSTNRQLTFHPLTAGDWREGLHAVSAWLVPASSHTWLQAAAASVVCALLVYIAIEAWRGATRNTWRLYDANCTSVLWLVTGFYLSGLLLARSFADGAIPLDSRTLSPVLLALLVLVPSHLRDVSRSTHARAILVVPLLALMTLYALRATRWAEGAHADGLHYNARRWQQIRALDIIRGMPSCVTLYASNPQLAYWITGRRAWPLDKNAWFAERGLLVALRSERGGSTPFLAAVVVHDFGGQGQTQGLAADMSYMTKIWEDSAASMYASTRSASGMCAE